MTSGTGVSLELEAIVDGVIIIPIDDDDVRVEGTTILLIEHPLLNCSVSVHGQRQDVRSLTSLDQGLCELVRKVGPVWKLITLHRGVTEDTDDGVCPLGLFKWRGAETLCVKRHPSFAVAGIFFFVLYICGAHPAEHRVTDLVH
jgi:hypothetical protein